MEILQKIRSNKKLYPGVLLKKRIPPQFSNIFDDELIDLFEKMLEIDPEYRLTIS